MDPQLTRVNWARPHFQTALTILRKRLVIVPKLPKLRTVHRAAIDAAEVASKQKTDGSRKAAAAAADACVVAFREAETGGADLPLPVELNKGKARPLRDDQRDCAAGRSEAAATPVKDETKPATPVTPEGGDVKPDETKPGETKPAVAKGGSDGGVPRPKWLKALKGDRKKVFLDHEDAFPAFDGDPGPKGAAKAAEWAYGSAKASGLASLGMGKLSSACAFLRFVAAGGGPVPCQQKQGTDPIERHVHPLPLLGGEDDQRHLQRKEEHPRDGVAPLQVRCEGHYARQ